MIDLPEKRESNEIWLSEVTRTKRYIETFEQRLILM